MDGDIIAFDESTPAWERAFYAFLAEKERRSGSRRTVESYSRMLSAFSRRWGSRRDCVPGLDGWRRTPSLRRGP